jgi:hypothetical protein
MNKRKRVAMLKHRKRRIKVEAKNKALAGSVEGVRKVSKMRSVARESINLSGQKERLSESTAPKSRTSSASAGKTNPKKVLKKDSPSKKVAKSKKLESSAEKPKTRAKKNSN